jgi:hypothetical protein
MNTKEITLPDGWVIDKQVGNKLILKEDKPKLDTWEKCFAVLHYPYGLVYINHNSDISGIGLGETAIPKNHKVFPREYSSAMLALTQLLVCYKAWVGDWKPDWKNLKNDKYCISVQCDKIIRHCVTTTQHILLFPTSDMRDKFLETFKDLLKQAKPLL